MFLRKDGETNEAYLARAGRQVWREAHATERVDLQHLVGVAMRLTDGHCNPWMFDTFFKRLMPVVEVRTCDPGSLWCQYDPDAVSYCTQTERELGCPHLTPNPDYVPLANRILDALNVPMYDDASLTVAALVTRIRQLSNELQEEGL
jgi:hypothetical protein